MLGCSTVLNEMQQHSSHFINVTHLKDTGDMCGGLVSLIHNEHVAMLDSLNQW
jgi:hypothetical protein